MGRTAPASLPKPSEEAKAAFSELIPDEPAVTLKPMFGEDLLVRLPEPEIAAVKKQGGRDFEPMPGRVMRGYVILPKTWRTKPDPAVVLIKRSLALTRTMPAKAPKEAPAKKA